MRKKIIENKFLELQTDMDARCNTIFPKSCKGHISISRFKANKLNIEIV